MELAESKRRRYVREQWRLYIPKEDEVTTKVILEALAKAGHPVTPTSTYWKKVPRAMFLIPFEGALLVSEQFPNPRFKRILFHSGTRGMYHWREESLARNPLVEEYDNSAFSPRKKTPGLLRFKRV